MSSFLGVLTGGPTTGGPTTGGPATGGPATGGPVGEGDLEQTRPGGFEQGCAAVMVADETLVHALVAGRHELH
jgi:hypothetical protein